MKCNLKKAIFLLGFLAICASGLSPAFRQFAHGLEVNTVRALIKYNCEPVFLPKRETRGVERWTDVILHCRGLGHSVSTIRCDRRCLDPITCKPMRQLKSFSYYFDQTVVLANGNSTTINLPVACICIPRKLTSKKCNVTQPLMMN